MNNQERLDSLMPDGAPRYVRIYDNGGRTADRYTVVYTGRYRYMGQRKRNASPRCGHYTLCMSERPRHPQGVYALNETDRVVDTPRGWAPPVGARSHLGVRIKFEALPEQCRHAAIGIYKEIWRL